MPFLILKAQKPIHGLPKELNTIGDHIRNKRLKSTEPLKKIALKLSTDEWTLINWENNRTKNIPAKYYPKITEFLTYCPLEKPPTTFAEKIKFHRLYFGLNQKQFARLLKVNLTTVKFWESGKRIPSIKMLNKLRELIF